MQSRIIKDPVNWDDGLDYYPEIFSITAENVTYLLTSNQGGKIFRKSDLPTDAVRIICKAQLSNSLQDEVGMSNLHEWIYAGVCYYGYNEMYGENTYISVYDESVPEGKLGEQYEFDFLIDTYLDDDKTYYSFVKNASERGYVYGTVKLFYSYFEE